jgi:hypothetical protein
MATGMDKAQLVGPLADHVVGSDLSRRKAVGQINGPKPPTIGRKHGKRVPIPSGTVVLEDPQISVGVNDHVRATLLSTTAPDRNPESGHYPCMR